MKTEQIKKGKKVIYQGREFEITDVFFGISGNLRVELKAGSYTIDAMPEECEVSE